MTIFLQVTASSNEWVQLVGNLQLDAGDPPLGNLYFSGAPPGVDILLNNVYVLRDSLIEQVLSPSQPQVRKRLKFLPHGFHFATHI